MNTFLLHEIARTLPGVKIKEIHNDMQRLGYLIRQYRKWRITPKGAKYFVYREHDMGDTAVATETGRSRIMDHYLDNELTIWPLYDLIGEMRLYHSGSVVKLALDQIEQLTPAEKELVEEFLAGTINEFSIYHPTTMPHNPVRVCDRLAVLGAKLDNHPLRENDRLWRMGWRPINGAFSKMVPPPVPLPE